MRYQFGMSVGHTYMHGPDFPTATIPSLPSDFDYCLDHDKREHAQGPSSTDSTSGAVLSVNGPSESLIEAVEPAAATGEDGEGLNEEDAGEGELDYCDDREDWERDAYAEMYPCDDFL
jgi:hypothetical protein